MEKFRFNRAITVVVAFFALMFATSCVNEEYELSEDRLDLNVTVFQEGISIPLGSTKETTVEELYNLLDEESKKMLLQLEDAYMFSMSDSYDMTEVLAEAFSDLGLMEAIKVDESFAISLNNVDLSSLQIKGQEIAPQGIDVSGMVNVPDVQQYLPVINFDLGNISATLPEIDQSNFELDLSSLDDKTTIESELASLNGVIDSQLASLEIADMEMGFVQLGEELSKIPGASFLPSLPSMTTSFEFDPFVVTVPLEIRLPKQIKEVRSIQIDKDASLEIVVEIDNPLFTSGSLTPVLDVDIHNLFHIDRIESGVEGGTHIGGGSGSDDVLGHIYDNFTLAPNADPAHDWRADHIYHIDSLMISQNDWRTDGDELVLVKNVDISVSGKLQDNELKTSLKYLYEHGDKPMSMNLQVKFNNLKIDNVEVLVDDSGITDIDPIEKDIEINLSGLPELVKQIEYVDFDDNSPLNISMKANVPAACSSLDLMLKTLKIEFPQGMVINYGAGQPGKFDSKTSTLEYTNVSLTKGINDQVVIDRIELPEIVGGALTYNGKIKVTAEASVGALNSKDLIAAGGGKIELDMNVSYAPQLTDYSVVIDDYVYDVKVDPVKVNAALGKEVGEMLKDKTIYVALKKNAQGQNPTISINLDYPEHKAIQIMPKEGEGLKIDFPDLLKFTQATVDAYKINTTDNSLHFTSANPIPKNISLEIDRIAVSPEYVEAEDNYYINDEMTITGGVRLAGTRIGMQDVKDLQNMTEKVEFGASIPDLEPAQLALDEYQMEIDENVVVEGLEIELPEMIQSIRISEILLKEVYLDMLVDASALTDILGKVDMKMTADIQIPEMLIVEGVGEGNVLHIENNMDENNNLAIGPIKVIGLDLSGIETKDGKLVMGEQNISVKGSVELKNVSVDLEKLEEKEMAISISGGLASKVDEGENIIIDKIVGNVGLAIDPVEDVVDLSFVSEVLNGPNISVALDLNAFWLTLDVNTNLDVPVDATLDLVPWYAGQAGDKITRNISMDPQKRVNDMYSFFISNVDPKAPGHDGKYDVYKSHEYVNLDLVSLLYDQIDSEKPVVADSVSICLNAGISAEKTCVIEPTKEYVLKADYSVGVPVELGENFRFEFRDTVDVSTNADWLAQILSYGSVGLGGKFINGLPLNLNLQIRPIDENGDAIALKEGVGIMKIASCDAKGNPVTTDLDFVISGEGADLTKMAAIELYFTADAKDAAGVPLRPGTYVKSEFFARIPEGVTVDLRDIIGDGETEQEQN
jgi:hypothetical protein